nr:putative KTx Tcis25 [Tityus cisandinus]
MHFSGIVFILIGMTLINTFFPLTIVEATAIGKCNPFTCDEECRTKGNKRGYCENYNCECSKWKR